MLDVGSSELLLIIIVAIVVIGPKDLPRVLYKLGQIIGKGRAMTRHFRSGIDEMIRQAELEEMEKKWAADNARIMAQAQEAPPVATAEELEGVPPALPAPEGEVPPAAEPAAEEAHHFRAEPAPEPTPPNPESVRSEPVSPESGDKPRSQDGSPA